MKAGIRIAMLVTLTACGTIASSAQEPRPAVDQSKPVASAPAPDDNMTPYRKLAADALNAFQAHDMPAAKRRRGSLKWRGTPTKKRYKRNPPSVGTNR